MMKSNLLQLTVVLGVQLAFGVSNASIRPYCINNEQKQTAKTFVVDFIKMQDLFEAYKLANPENDESLDPSDLEISDAEARTNYTKNQYKLWKISKELRLGKSQESLVCDYINVLSSERNKYQPMPVSEFNLTLPEAMSIYAYTEDLFKIINPALRGKTNHLKQIAAVIKQLDLGLSKLPPYQGVVLRGVNLPKNMTLKIGGTFSDPAYLSTSTSNPYGGTHQFIIHSKTGRQVEMFSPNPDEKEVLFKRNTPFKIIDIRNSNGVILVELAE